MSANLLSDIDLVNIATSLLDHLIVRVKRCIYIYLVFQEVNPTMANKAELIEKVVESVDGLNKKQATAAVDAVFATIQETLAKGDKVQLIGFGNFEVRERAARKGRNPQTGAEIEIAASKVPAFKPGKALKDAVK